MCLIFVGQGYSRKFFNLEHFPIYNMHHEYTVTRVLGDENWKYIYVCNSCNMGMSRLPDVYIPSMRAEGVCIRQTMSALVTTNNIPLSYRVHQPANKVRNMKSTITTRQYSLRNKYNFEMISKFHFLPPFKRYNRLIVYVYTINKSFNCLLLLRPHSHNCTKSSVHS